MRFVDEFRDPALARALVQRIAAAAARIAERRGRPTAIMEICGGHRDNVEDHPWMLCKKDIHIEKDGSSMQRKHIDYVD